MPAPVTRLTWWLRVQTPFIRSGVSVAMGVAGIGVHLGGWPGDDRCGPMCLGVKTGIYWPGMLLDQACSLVFIASSPVL